MRKLLFPVLCLCVFISCSKKDIQPEIITEPPPTITLENDTLYTGDFWGLAINDTHKEVYAKLQAMSPDKKIDMVNVSNNVFSSVTGLSAKIPLYQNLFFDEQSGTSTGVQLSFADNKIKTIFLNSGVLLYQWPAFAPASAVLKTGDPVESVYSKLVAISQLDAYKNKLQHLMLLTKRLDTPYDDGMDASGSWMFGSPVGINRVYHVELNFQNGKLYSIHYTLSESI